MLFKAKYFTILSDSMIKLIILSIIGKKLVSTTTYFNSIKGYLVFYMLLLPVFMSAGEQKNKDQPAVEIIIKIVDEDSMQPVPVRFFNPPVILSEAKDLVQIW